MEESVKDLCKDCEHYWLDFPLPLDRYVGHCTMLGLKELDDVVPYPCLKCPFDSYIEKKGK